VIADRAAQLGIAVRHIPFLSTGLTDEAVGSMVQALDDLPRPILAYAIPAAPARRRSTNRPCCPAKALPAGPDGGISGETEFTGNALTHP